MKYESEILETIHEDASTDFKLGFISETRMREYDEMCLAPETTQDNKANETTHITQTRLATA